uniref:C-type lectin domain-containing protein n=1 Tax=Oryzias latipes TaxID=8090 RepID=A0A3B3HSE6_ORYLA
FSSFSYNNFQIFLILIQTNKTASHVLHIQTFTAVHFTKILTIWEISKQTYKQNQTLQKFYLATARTSTNWQALSSVMPSYQNLWIGVYRDLNISWSDGTLPSFYPTTLNFYIRPSVVSARCGYHKWLNKNNWFFSTCERKYPFICHKGEFSITVF